MTLVSACANRMGTFSEVEVHRTSPYGHAGCVIAHIAVLRLLLETGLVLLGLSVSAIVGPSAMQTGSGCGWFDGPGAMVASR